MKRVKIFSVIMAAVTAVCCTVTVYGEEPKKTGKPSENDISAKAAVLIEADSERIIWGKCENTRLPMASTTKIMSTVIALESGDPDSEFTVDSGAVHTEGSSMGLREGDKVSLMDLCIGMLLPSGNDAANCTAVRVSGSIPEFVDRMNAKAAGLKLTDTHFVTPSGLHDPEHYSTAYDMARLAAYALNIPEFADICGSSTKKLSFGNPPYNRYLTNTNKLLDRYEGCIGVKTGFTDEAGRCLVSAAERNGVRLICVTLNAPDDWNDHEKLYDYGFSQTQIKEYPVSIEYSPALAGGITDKIRLVPEETPVYTEVKGQESHITCRIAAPPMIYAPVQQGTRLGEVILYDDDKEIGRIPMVAAESAPRSSALPPKTSIKDRIVTKIKEKLWK